MATPAYYIYVVSGTHNTCNNTISVIDTSSNEVVASITNANYCDLGAMAATPNGEYILVPNCGNEDNGSVVVIDVVTNTVVQTITGFYDPHAIAISPDGQTAYVTCNSAIQVVSLETFSITSTIRTTAGGTTYSYPMAIAISPDGNTLYVTTYVNISILQVDLTQTPPAIQAIAIDGIWTLPALAVTSDGSSLYVVNNTENNILHVDLTQKPLAISGTIKNNPGTIQIVAPDAIVINDSLAYVMNTKTNLKTPFGIAVIDLSTNTVSMTIPIVAGQGITLTPDGQEAYISTANNTVTGITLSNNTLLGTSIPVPSNSNSIVAVYKPCTANCYYSYVATDQGVVVLNAEGSVVTTIESTESFLATVVSPDGNYIYAATADNIVVIQALNNNVVNQIPITLSSPTSIFMAVHPSGKAVYLVSNGSTAIMILDTEDNTISTVDSPNTGSIFGGLAVTLDGKYIYITDSANQNVLILNAYTNGITQPFGTNIFAQPQGIAITPNGQYAYVCNYEAFNVAVIDIESNSVVHIQSTGQGVDIAITPDGQYAYVSCTSENQITVLDLTNNTVSATLKGDDFSTPEGVEITPDGNYAYVCNKGTNSIAQIELSTNQVQSQITIGINSPVSLAFRSFTYY